MDSVKSFIEIEETIDLVDLVKLKYLQSSSIYLRLLHSIKNIRQFFSRSSSNQIEYTARTNSDSINYDGSGFRTEPNRTLEPRLFRHKEPNRRTEPFYSTRTGTGTFLSIILRTKTGTEPFLEARDGLNVQKNIEFHYYCSMKRNMHERHEIEMNAYIL